MDGRAVAVDDTMATSLPGVRAVGDAIGGLMLAHKAMVEGRVAAENVTGGSRRADYRSVPNVVFTRPEVASVGLTMGIPARASIIGKMSPVAPVFDANQGKTGWVVLKAMPNLMVNAITTERMFIRADDKEWTLIDKAGAFNRPVKLGVHIDTVEGVTEFEMPRQAVRGFEGVYRGGSTG